MSVFLKIGIVLIVGVIALIEYACLMVASTSDDIAEAKLQEWYRRMEEEPEEEPKE